MPKRNATVAKFSVALSSSEGAEVPEWIKLVPSGQLKTVDGRGPYVLNNPQSVIASSRQAADRLPIDENHATDLAAANGGQAPARGWIVELSARDDGIWGRVEWTESGKALLTDRAYRHISPVLRVATDGSGTILTVLRAALTNTPNLRGLVALNTEGNGMELLQKIRQLLGLDEGASDDEIFRTIAAIIDKAAVDKAEGANALQSALKPIAVAAGLEDGADATAILGRVETLVENAKETSNAGKDEAITALQSELASTASALNSLKGDIAKKAAEAFVDGEIKRGRVGLKPMRDHYIARHVKEAAEVEKEILAMPVLDPGVGLLGSTPNEGDGQVSLNSAEQSVCTMLGIPQDKFKETRDAERAA